MREAGDCTLSWMLPQMTVDTSQLWCGQNSLSKEERCAIPWHDGLKRSAWQLRLIFGVILLNYAQVVHLIFSHTSEKALGKAMSTFRPSTTLVQTKMLQCFMIPMTFHTDVHVSQIMNHNDFVKYIGHSWDHHLAFVTHFCQMCLQVVVWLMTHQV